MIKTKLRHIFLFICFVVSFLLMSSRAEAFLGLLPSSVMDPGALATQTLNNINAEINKVGTFMNEQIKETLNRIKSLKERFENLLGKKKTVKIPAIKKIEESKIAKIYDENSISLAFKKLFFEYPSDQPDIMLAYRKKGREFYDDTLIEAFTASREFEKNIVQINQKIIDASNNKDATDYNSGLQVLLELNSTTDELLMIIQELVAIKMQMIAADAVLNRVEPLYYGKPSVGLKFE